MNTFKSAALALTLIASAGAASASCTVTAAKVDGNFNFFNLEASGCGYTSADLTGSHSFADIINIFGALVTGIYGNGNFYEVKNVGDNEVGIYVNGRNLTTKVRIIGEGNEFQLSHTGEGSTFEGTVTGNGNRFKGVVN